MIKELIEKYKKIKEETIIIKENIPPKIETIQLEREFPIEVIASTLENRLLAPLEDIEDFWNFITNENVNLSNIQRFLTTIQNEIFKQYPNFKILGLSNNELYLSDTEVTWLNNWYKEYNGDTIVIKSLKKGCIKTLTM